jgi:hypothetical protein
VALHAACEALALAGAGDIDEGDGREGVGGEDLADLVLADLVGGDGELAVDPLGVGPAFMSCPIIGMVELRGLRSWKPICTAL